jgi:hypothetical protein
MTPEVSRLAGIVIVSAAFVLAAYFWRPTFVLHVEIGYPSDDGGDDDDEPLMDPAPEAPRRTPEFSRN